MDILKMITANKQFNECKENILSSIKTAEAKKGIETAFILASLYAFHSPYQSKEFKDACSKEWSD